MCSFAYGYVVANKSVAFYGYRQSAFVYLTLSFVAEKMEVGVEDLTIPRYADV